MDHEAELRARVASLERELRELRGEGAASQHRLLRFIVNATENLVYARDLEGRYVFVNDRYCEATGLEREEILGRTPLELGPAETGEALLAHDRQVIEESRAIVFEEEAALADGPHRFRSLKAPFPDERGVVTAVAGITTDVTERLRLEASLRESEEKFRLAFHANPQAINLNRLVDGTYLDINEGFTRIMGYTRDDVIGRTSLELGIWADAEDRATLVRGLAATGAVDGLQARFRRKSGELAIGVMSARTLEIGGVPVVLSITSDVTTRIELEERYRHAQKLEAIGRLAAGIAHDFNNLLIPILNYADMVRGTLDERDERAAMIDDVLLAGRRGASLTKQILAFSRKQVLEVRPLDLGDLVADLGRMLGRLLKANVALRLETASGLRVLADRTQIEQILMNLAVNAADAMPGGGTLTIALGEEHLDGERLGRSVEPPVPGRYAAITVRDTGSGMDEATLQHLFEPFFTTKEKGKGTGLGLATVFGCVKQHGGHIAVSSEPGHGSTFKVFLPLGTDEAAPPPQRVVEPPARAGEGKVLVVEDDEGVLKLVERVLSMNGYSVLAASDAATAIRLSDAGELRDLRLLVTDVVMPGESGLELAAALRRRHHAARVLFMSGYTDEVFGQRTPSDLDGPLLQKPFDVKALLGKVRAALGE